jgi:hypothetical protein
MNYIPLVAAYDADTYNGDGSLKRQSIPCNPGKFVAGYTGGASFDGVYVILNPDNGLCKIGRTAGIKSRLYNLQTACGSPLQVLLHIELEPGYDEDAGYLEKWLHTALRERREIGEWFRLSVKDLIELRNLFHHIYGSNIEEHPAWSEKDERQRIFTRMRHLENHDHIHPQRRTRQVARQGA